MYRQLISTSSAPQESKFFNIFFNFEKWFNVIIQPQILTIVNHFLTTVPATPLQSQSVKNIYS